MSQTDTTLLATHTQAIESHVSPNSRSPFSVIVSFRFGRCCTSSDLYGEIAIPRIDRIRWRSLTSRGEQPVAEDGKADSQTDDEHNPE
jgi:hypothetical protein